MLFTIFLNFEGGALTLNGQFWPIDLGNQLYELEYGRSILGGDLERSSQLGQIDLVNYEIDFE